MNTCGGGGYVSSMYYDGEGYMLNKLSQAKITLLQAFYLFILLN